MRADLLSLLGTSTLVMSVAIVIVWLLRAPMRRTFGAQAGYALWLVVPIVTVAALIPVPAPQALTQWTSVATSTVAEVVSARVPPITVERWNPLPAVFIAWLLGVVAMALMMLLQQRHYLSTLGALTALGDGIHRAKSPNAGPALVGLFVPKIVVPADFDARFDADERTLMIAHERTHRARGDAWANAFVAALRSVFWFNPLVHAAARAFRIDQEIACDAEVVATHPNQRRAYAAALLKAQFVDVPVPLGCQWTSSLPLRERILALRASQPGRTSRRIGLLFASALAAVLAVTAWAVQPAQMEELLTDREQVVNVSIRLNEPKLSLPLMIEALALSRALQSAPTDEPAPIQATTEVGVPIVISGGMDKPEWRLEMRFWILPDGLIEAKLYMSGLVAVSSWPSIILRSGVPARVDIGKIFGLDPEWSIEIDARAAEMSESMRSDRAAFRARTASSAD